MKRHNLKLEGQYLHAILSGDKRFELRKNDRGYEVGDVVTFSVLDRDTKAVADLASRTYQITYVLKDVPYYHLQNNYCIFGFGELKPEKESNRGQLEIGCDFCNNADEKCSKCSAVAMDCNVCEYNVGNKWCKHCGKNLINKQL